jgi:hypothetical protein
MIKKVLLFLKTGSLPVNIRNRFSSSFLFGTQSLFTHASVQAFCKDANLHLISRQTFNEYQAEFEKCMAQACNKHTFFAMTEGSCF